jgi:hypothetical protein
MVTRRLLIVGTIACGILLSAPTSRADGEHEVTFRTPSGNIRCDGWSLGPSLTDNTVMCAVMSTRVKVTYQCPDVGVGCPDVFTLNATGRVEIARASYQTGTSRTLAYGQTLTLGHLRCVSRFAGLTCTSMYSRHGFFLSRQRLNTW